MKYKIFTICLLSISILFTRCSYLDIVPDNTVEVESLFENRDKALNALSTCYRYMPNYEKVHTSMSLAGDEWVGRLDSDYAGDRGINRGIKIMRGWNNPTTRFLTIGLVVVEQIASMKVSASAIFSSSILKTYPILHPKKD